MEDNEKQYIKGFNNGYLIAQHQPDLFEKLEKGLKASNDYTQGLISGGKEHSKEKSIARHKELRNEKEKGKQNLGKEKGMDRER